MKFLVLLAVMLYATACNSVKHSYQTGDFDKAVEKAVKKIKSDPKDEESISYLEASYAKLARQANERISFLKKEGRPENVLPVYDELSELRLYEEMIKPLLPLYISSKKRYATFNFVKDEDFIAAKQGAGEYLYAYAIKLLNSGSKADARHAYGLLEELKCIYPDYKDADQKMNEARMKGTNQVYVKMVNNSGAYLFADLEKQITTMPLGDLNSQWVNFYGNSNQNQSPDYSVLVNIRQIMVTPDIQLAPNIYTETKSVQDGWEYALDKNGNVKKDSAGNDIKVSKYKTIKCIVTEYLQQKSSTIGGTLDFYQGNSLLYSYPFTTTKLFQHAWATANGDLNALSKESSAKIQVGPAPYPSEIDMLYQAGEDLKFQMRNAINDKMELVVN